MPNLRFKIHRKIHVLFDRQAITLVAEQPENVIRHWTRMVLQGILNLARRLQTPSTKTFVTGRDAIQNLLALRNSNEHADRNKQTTHEP